MRSRVIASNIYNVNCRNVVDAEFAPHLVAKSDFTVDCARRCRRTYTRKVHGGSVLIVSKYADASPSKLYFESLCPVCSSLNYLTLFVAIFSECQTILLLRDFSFTENVIYTYPLKIYYSFIV